MYDIFFIDSGHWDADVKYAVLRTTHPQAKRLAAEIDNTLGTLRRAAKAAMTPYFWVVFSDLYVTEFDFGFEVAPDDAVKTRIWPACDVLGGNRPYKGALLLNRAAFRKAPDSERRFDFYSYDAVAELHRVTPMIEEMSADSDAVGWVECASDVIFLSYEEPDAEQKWEAFKERFPWAKRVHGVRGIHAAHKRAAETASTRYFYVVDADALVIDNHTFDWMPPLSDPPQVHIWYAENPCNGLRYGYGGVKLFPRHEVLILREEELDFTMSVAPLVVHEEIVSVTEFNTDAWGAWKSGFREAVKLARASDPISAARLDVWCDTMSDAPFAKQAMLGARAGRDFVEFNGVEGVALKTINDFATLKQMYAEAA